ncbi:MAG: hypothetical protein V4727_05430 [Verrucomicrobiota bacterium]
MNALYHELPLPDVATVASELTMTDRWDSEAVSHLISSKCDHRETPAFLFLGKKETLLLKRHLASAFGEESVTTLHDTYYMGLDVVVIDCESFIFAGGRKKIRTLSDPISHRPQWRGGERESLWQFHI